MNNIAILKQDIKQETAKRILYLIRLGHPTEHNESYDRGDVIEEIERRGLQILKDLGWDTKFTAKYKNRYTGHETTLIDELRGVCNREFSYHNLFGLLEHYEPIAIWTDKDCFDEYKLKATLGGWGV